MKFSREKLLSNVEHLRNVCPQRKKVLIHPTFKVTWLNFLNALWNDILGFLVELLIIFQERKSYVIRIVDNFSVLKNTFFSMKHMKPMNKSTYFFSKLKNRSIHYFRSQWTLHLEARAITKTLTMSKNFSSFQKFFPLIKRKTFPFFKSYSGKFFTFLILCCYSRGI